MSSPRPNILVTGTPGVGKSTLAKEIAKRAGMEWINVGEVALTNNCIESPYDEVYECPVIDEDKLLQVLSDQISSGGKIVDYHSCDFFPQSWFDFVLVLRTDNSILYDRLDSRGYRGKKLSDNIECEIFQTILEDAHEFYNPSIVHELKSNLPEDVSKNVETVLNLLLKGPSVEGS